MTRPDARLAKSPPITGTARPDTRLPAHQHHQRKAEQQEEEPGEAVLDSDDLMVGGENVLPPEPELLVMCVVHGVR